MGFRSDIYICLKNEDYKELAKRTAELAKNENEVIGILKGHACYENAYIDDLIVIESHRRKGLGMKLIKKAEDYCKNNSFRSISLWTNKFQNTLKFYEKCEFKIEFTRENEENPKFTKYLLIKYF